MTATRPSVVISSLFCGQINITNFTTSVPFAVFVFLTSIFVLISLHSCFDVPSRFLFKSEMRWTGAAVAIPMFPVRSDDDVGVGEFLDLKLVVDWAVDSGFHLLQLLPTNDTSVNKMCWDSYPYSSLSVFALHPLYLRLDALSENILDDINKEIQKAMKEVDGKHVDYEATMTTKLSIAKKIFNLEKDCILFYYNLIWVLTSFIILKY